MTSLLERRLAAEWELLEKLAERNPGRITDLHRDGAVFRLCLHGPSARAADPAAQPSHVADHGIRIEFPVHFPAVPMEMFLEVPVFHPNVHPETGFVCLWDQHRVSNTVEHALHKTVAILSGSLRNPEALHVMQPEALEQPVLTEAMPLLGLVHQAGFSGEIAAVRRRRLE